MCVHGLNPMKGWPGGYQWPQLSWAVQCWLLLEPQLACWHYTSAFSQEQIGHQTRQKESLSKSNGERQLLLLSFSTKHKEKRTGSRLKRFKNVLFLHKKGTETKRLLFWKHKLIYLKRKEKKKWMRMNGSKSHWKFTKICIWLRGNRITVLCGYTFTLKPLQKNNTPKFQITEWVLKQWFKWKQRTHKQRDLGGLRKHAKYFIWDSTISYWLFPGMEWIISKVITCVTGLDCIALF